MSQKILVTHPGRIGDCLWAAATMRLIAERAGEPVDLLVSPMLAGVGELLKLQPYIGEVIVDRYWEVRDTAPATPFAPNLAEDFREDRELKERYAKIIHLGYRQWPKEQLAREVYQIACVDGELNPLDLGRPWIQAPEVALDHNHFRAAQVDVVIGFTDEWAELKAGLAGAMVAALPTSTCLALLVPPGGSRLSREWEWYWGERDGPDDWPGAYPVEANWMQAAHTIAGAKVFLGCLSSLAVLAMALGKPRVLVEPEKMRHHPIFQHPDCPLVVGNDGLPTHDARHVADALRLALR